MKLATDHGWPVASDGTDGHGLEAFKNERDYIAQGGRLKTTVAAMDWAAREIEKLRTALRRLAIVQVHRPAENKSTVRVGTRCTICDTDWSSGQPETHAASCVLANSN